MKRVGFSIIFGMPGISLVLQQGLLLWLDSGRFRKSSNGSQCPFCNFLSRMRTMEHGASSIQIDPDAGTMPFLQLCAKRHEQLLNPCP